MDVSHEDGSGGIADFEPVINGATVFGNGDESLAISAGDQADHRDDRAGHIGVDDFFGSTQICFESVGSGVDAHGGQAGESRGGEDNEFIHIAYSFLKAWIE